MNRSTAIRRCLLTSAVMVVLAPVLVWASYRSVDSMFNIPPYWVPPTNPQRRVFDWFNEHFEGMAVVIVSWPGCTVDDARLQALEHRLIGPSDSANSRQDRPLFAGVQTGYSALRGMMDEPLGLSRQQALDRLRGSLVGADQESSCAVVVLTSRGGYQRQRAIRIIRESAADVCGVEEQQIYVAGAPVIGTTIDETSKHTLLRFALPSALVALLACWACLRSWRYALIILAAAAFGEGLVLSLVFLSAEPMNALLIVMPSLVLVLTVAAGVHLANYYYDELRSGPAEGAVQRAVASGWQPCVLAAVTTAIGMSSLLISEVFPIRMFGGLSAVGVMVSVVLLLAILPGVLEMWPLKSVTAGATVSRWPSRWLACADFVSRYHASITVLALASMAVLGGGLTAVRTSVQLQDLFAARSRIVQQYEWLQDRVGPMISVEVVIHFAPDCPWELIDRLELVQQVASELERGGEVQGVVSAATFAPDIPRGGGARQMARRWRVGRELKRQKHRFVDAHYLHEDDDGQAWRISARVPALTDLDSALLLRRLRAQVNPLLPDKAASDRPWVRASYTGAIPLIYQTQRILLKDLFVSFLTAFGIVAVVMMIVLRSVGAGLVAMIPNVFPALTIFGLMGWLRIPVDMGTVMTASIALGIAVVDTLHFLTWFRREVAQGRPPPFAVRSAFRHCAAAMIQTSVICGSGMLVFVASGFVPASRFAWMVCILLAAALLGDLLILPALLVGPLGRAFIRRSKSK
jgi:predicted RND superfamily exporter protein